MANVHFDAAHSDEERRAHLYSGDLYVYSATNATRRLSEFSRGMIEDAFGGRPPETAQYDMPVEDYANLLAKFKPAFIHHPDSKKLIM